MIEDALACRMPSRLRVLAMGGMVALLLLGFQAPLSTLVLAETPAEDHEVVSGVLRSLNLPEKRGVIATDLGTQVPFEITKPELFINLSVGQRVTLKLDKQGRALRVMDNAAPELPPPSVPR